MKNIKSYFKLITIPTFKERFEYLKLTGVVGADTFGYDRYLNQILYKSYAWRKFRDKIIIRDDGCDLACEGFTIYDRILIHHLNPITVDDVINRHYCVFDENNVVCVSHRTHNGIHYGDSNNILVEPIVRSRNDTCPWKQYDKGDIS